MSDDNNQKNRGPRKGGAGGRGGGPGGRAPGSGGKGGSGERGDFGRDGSARPFRGRSEGGDDRPRRGRPEGEERPARHGSKPFSARDGAARSGGDKPFRPKRDGERRPQRAEGERPRRMRDEAVEPRILPSTRQHEPERIAKVMARAGVASRRESEAMIAEGRVNVNGSVLESPAFDVGPNDVVLVDGEPLPERERTRLWLYHKPRGLVTTNHDPEGRPTVFENLPEDLPRVLSIGRLDINTEGLLLLTNDGGLARMLELPETGWLRRYRVRAFGSITQDKLDTLKDGVTIDGVSYGPVIARFEREQGSNTWLTVDLREGKNREVKTVLEHLGLAVNRLIRVSFGPFQLGEIEEGEAEEIRSRVLKDQLGEELMAKAGVDFEAPRREEFPTAPRKAPAGEDRPRRRRSEEAEDRPAAHPLRGDKPWTRSVWRDEEAEPQRKHRAPPRRGADPKAEREVREATGELIRKRDKAIADPKGRRVLVERVSSSALRDEPPRETPPRRERRPDRKPRQERGAAEERPARRDFSERPARGGSERPARRFDRTGGEERRGRDEGGAGERPARGRADERRSAGGKTFGAKGFGGRSSDDRPAGDRPFRGKPGGAGGKSFGDKSFGGKSFGGKSFGGKPGGGRPGGGRPGGGKGPRPGGGGAPRGRRG